MGDDTGCGFRMRLLWGLVGVCVTRVGSASLGSSSEMCACMCSYVDKLTEFLRLCVTVHLSRFQHSPQFPVVDFLTVLFRFTFQQVT